MRIAIILTVLLVCVGCPAPPRKPSPKLTNVYAPERCQKPITCSGTLWQTADHHWHCGGKLVMAEPACVEVAQ